jgi:two-component system, response regulator
MSLELEILLVEDKRSDAEMAIRAFHKHNIASHIVHLKDGKEALDFLFGSGNYTGRDTSYRPKVIILDMKMPKISGQEVLQKIRSHELTCDIPVVIFSSSKENPDIQKCYALGVSSYVVKPVAFDQFMEVVSDIGKYWVLNNQVTYK